MISGEDLDPIHKTPPSIGQNPYVLCFMIRKNHSKQRWESDLVEFVETKNPDMCSFCKINLKKEKTVIEKLVIETWSKI